MKAKGWERSWIKGAVPLVQDVIPQEDDRAHVYWPDRCSCLPTVAEYRGGNLVVTHRAWDGREITESAIAELLKPQSGN